MQATVEYASGRRYGVGSAHGVQVSVVKHFLFPEITVRMSFAGALSTGDLSGWQLDFGKGTACDLALIQIPPAVARRLAQALLQAADVRGESVEDAFVAVVDGERDYNEFGGQDLRVDIQDVPPRPPSADQAEP